MSIAYLDPGNIESDLQSGAKAGFKVLTTNTLQNLGRNVHREIVSELMMITIIFVFNSEASINLSNFLFFGLFLSSSCGCS